MLFRTDKVYLTDGTAKGTKAIAELPEGFGYSSDISQIDGRLTFFIGHGLQAMDARTGSFVVPDNEPAGADAFAGGGILYPDVTTAFGPKDWLLIGPNVVQHYRLGGELETIRTDIRVTSSKAPCPIDDRGWFIGQDGSNRDALYASDGTADGTVPFFVRDEDDSRLDLIQIDQDWIVGGRMLFAGRDGDGVVSVFATDGTDDGTNRIAYDVGFYQSGLVRADGRFVFGANGGSPADDMGVWSIDGTASGTREVADYADLAALASVGPKDALFDLMQPFVVGDDVFVAARVDRFPGSPRELAVFDVTGPTATLARMVTLPDNATLMRASSFQHVFVDTRHLAGRLVDRTDVPLVPGDALRHRRALRAPLSR